MPMTDRDELPQAPGTATRDLHDNAIQRLFAAELTLMSALARIPASDVRERIRESVAVLDEIIDDLRSVLHTRADGTRPGTPTRG